MASVACAPGAACGAVHSGTSHASKTPAAPAMTWEEVAMLVATAALAAMACRKYAAACAVGFAAGVVSGMYGDEWGFKRVYHSAVGGCSGLLSVAAQSTIPWPVGITAFILFNKHHLGHDPVYGAGFSFGLGIQIAHLARHQFFPPAGKE